MKLKLLNLLVVTCAVYSNNIYSNNIYSSDNIRSIENSNIINSNFQYLFYETRGNINSSKYCHYQYLRDQYEKETIESYNEVIKNIESLYSDNYDKEFISDLSFVFKDLYNNLNTDSIREQLLLKNTYISVDNLLKYKELFSEENNQSILQNKIKKNKIINELDEYLSKQNTNKKLSISANDFLYYIGNKILELGTNTFNKLNYKSLNDDEIVLNTTEKLKNILCNICNDLYGKNNKISKQNINKIEEKSNYDGEIYDIKNVCKYNLYLCNYEINCFYKNHYYELITNKVDNLHNRIIGIINKVINDINAQKIDNKIVNSNQYYAGVKLEYDILSKYNNVEPSKYKQLNIEIQENKQFKLKDYLLKVKRQLSIIKKFYNNKIALLHGDMEYDNNTKEQIKRDNEEALKLQKEGKLIIITNANPDYKNLVHDFNSYTDNYLLIAQRLINIIINDNNIQNEDLEKCFYDISVNRKIICDDIRVEDMKWLNEFSIV